MTTDEILKRFSDWVARSAGQHKRHVRKSFAESRKKLGETR
jgi:hypothetical protein